VTAPIEELEAALRWVSTSTSAQLITRYSRSRGSAFAIGKRLNGETRTVRNLAVAFFLHNLHFFTLVQEEASSRPTSR
jgi:hypothetical protein